MLLKSSNNSKYNSFFSPFVLKDKGTLINITISVIGFESRKICLAHRFNKFLHTLLFINFFGKMKPNLVTLCCKLLSFFLYKFFGRQYLKVKCLDFFFHPNAIIY